MAESANQDGEPGKPPGTRSSLADVMRQGREQKKKKGSDEEDVKILEPEAEVREEAASGSDSDEELMLIAGLSEVALLMKKPDSVNGLILKESTFYQIVNSYCTDPDQKALSTCSTGFLYDDKCTEHRNEWMPKFPEKPERVSEPYLRCCQLGLVDRCTKVRSRYATEDQVMLQHSQSLIEVLQSTTDMGKKQRMNLSKTYDSVYFHNSTYECALLSVGSSIEIMEQVLQKKVRNGFALVRPPGHHAMENEFCGFSFFNNVAIAAKHAVDNLGLNRVLIVDWDVHHGQATQQMFYNDPSLTLVKECLFELGLTSHQHRKVIRRLVFIPKTGIRVLYFSIHRYEYGKYWPNLRESDYDYIGEGEGLGYNINIPLNETGIGDTDYLSILQQVLMPIAYEFNPEIVLVSCGYDAAIGDPEGEMMVSPAAYAHFMHIISGLAEGRVVAILEGGYNVKSLSEGVALSIRTLLGDPCPSLLRSAPGPCDSVTESILNAIKCLRPYWRSLQYQTDLGEDDLCIYEEVNEDPPREGVEFSTPETKPKKYPLSYCYPFQSEEEYWETESKWDSLIDTLILETSLTVPPHRTCLVYDQGMKAHKALNYPGHPEKPERISRIYDKHKEWGLLERCLEVKCRVAEFEELALVHSTQHVEFMQELEEKENAMLKHLQTKYNSIYLCKETNICAKMAVGGTLEVVDKVLTGEARNGVAIVRPPGHHAKCGDPMGFCFFNTVAIAARYAQKNYNVKKVLILDWDVHHGNGTQQMFYTDPSVLYISIHRYDGGLFFPSSTDADGGMTGQGEGEGFNVNIPWNYGGKGDPEYLAAFQQVVMPIAYEYNPDLVLVSAGFDAAIGDPLGGCKVTPVGYGHMTHMLSSLANGKVIVVLEGGYNLVSIANSMSTCTSVLLGDSVPYWKYEAPQNIAVESICEVLDLQEKYWKCLRFNVALPVKENCSIRPSQGRDYEQELSESLSSTGISEESSKMSPPETGKKQEPPSGTGKKQEPPSGTGKKQEPPSGTGQKQEPPPRTGKKQEPAQGNIETSVVGDSSSCGEDNKSSSEKPSPSEKPQSSVEDLTSSDNTDGKRASSSNTAVC